jgi:hypothetical protein
MEKRNCYGCYNDDYNRGLGGAEECWGFKKAKLIMRKKVHVDDRPPWKQAPALYPSCYRQPRFVFMQPNREGW